MHFRFTNVNDAFEGMVAQFAQGQRWLVETSSRNGPVRQCVEPATITYEKPLERVLFNTQRDANPFFHLYEALWMLAGRHDVMPLSYYNSKISQYSDDGLVFNGAYGRRWRNALTADGYDNYDQLTVLIKHLRTKPDSRRAVLQMWNTPEDLALIDISKDCCCNLCAMFTINYGQLDMTVVNRSNDMIWGMFGANVCHFSFLHEYMAAGIDVPVGVYNQFSNNLHVYTDKFEPDKWLAFKPDEEHQYPVEGFVPLVRNLARFDLECSEFVERHSRDSLAGDYQEPFLAEVAQPMCIAFHHHKRRQYGDALSAVESIAAGDWYIAAKDWITKRKMTWEMKQHL